MEIDRRAFLATLGTEGKPASGKDGFRAPDDLVFDSQGNMYVADSGNGNKCAERDARKNGAVVRPPHPRAASPIRSAAPT